MQTSGEWMPVAAHPGELEVDAGDMLSRLSNGEIPSTTHRVVASREGSARSRYSMPFFAHPRPACDLSVLSCFVAEGEEPRTPPIRAGEFLAERLSEIGLGGADRPG